MKIEDILKLSSEEEKITRLKNRTTLEPNTEQLKRDWNPLLHDVMNPRKRKDGRKIKTAAYTDEKGNYHPDQFEKDPVNRIPLAIEQDQTNTHVAFTVGKAPIVSCDGEEG